MNTGNGQPISAILIPRAVCASLPEARAECGKSARPDPCGGYGVIRIPTATTVHPLRKQLWTTTSPCIADTIAETDLIYQLERKLKCS